MAPNVVGLYLVLAEVLSRKGLAVLPFEVVHQIWDSAQEVPTGPILSVLPRDPALTPPAHGCPFMTLPSELRRSIFANMLPAKTVTIKPYCGTAQSGLKTGQQTPKRNVASGLMTLNKKIKEEVTYAVYEERTFEIHVHAGTGLDAGIEFLNAGRQQLLYHEGVDEQRFERFAKNDEFGFSRLKKIRICVFEPQVITRHDPIALYYMHRALCSLIERPSGQNDRIISLAIRFIRTQRLPVPNAKRQDIIRAEHYWWDPTVRVPRATSIHELSDIELALRPFGNLTGIHYVDIILPSGVQHHAPTVAFVEMLKQSMKGQGPALSLGDDLEHKMSAARDALIDYIFKLRYGAKGDTVKDLTEAEAVEEGLLVDAVLKSISIGAVEKQSVIKDILGARKNRSTGGRVLGEK